MSPLRLLLSLLILLPISGLHAQRQMEFLGRGIVALRTSSTQTYIGWRLLGNDPEGVAFNLYRSANGATAVKVNATPLTATTDYVDTPGNLGTTAYTYSVRPVLGGVEVADTWANPAVNSASLPINAPTRQYIPIPLQSTPDDAAAGVSYGVKFCWVGDFDGNGEYDFLVERTNPSVEAKQWLQAYKRDGTLLWQMDMGPNSVDHYNITPGSSSIGIGHGDNVTVYDLDGDGRAEAIVRTANGVVFANGATLAAPNNEVQYISIIDGLTGVEKARASVPVPATWATQTHMNGQMGIVYADGLRPSLFFNRSNRNADGSFNKVATTWDFRNGVLTQRWTWPFSGHTAEGHQIRFADVNNDGTDEYVDVGHVLKADGSGQINGGMLTDVVHGDRFHVTDIDPSRPGLETYIIQQNNGTGLATAYFASDKSAVIKKLYAAGVVDVGRGTVGAFVPSVAGLQMFSTFGGTYDAKGDQLYTGAPFPPETIWWDGDLGREFLSTIGSDATSPGIDKFNTTNASTSRLLTLYTDTQAPNPPYNNYIAYGGRPQFWGDILGDWREELICVATDNSELRIYTTRTADTAKTHDGAPFRIYTLMHNPQYRIQATTKGYVQSSYVDYYLGYGMSPPPPPPMVSADLAWSGGTGLSGWDAGVTSAWKNTATSAASVFFAGRSVRFELTGNAAAAVVLSGALQPGEVTVYSPNDYTFDGTSGSLGGAMKLVKAGKGALRITGTHAFTGATTVWDGALRIDGALTGSALTVWGGTWGGAAARGLTGGRLSGSGLVSQPVRLGYRGAITPGAGMNAPGILALGGGLNARDGSVLAFDLSADPAGATLASDRLAITGNLTLAGTVTVVVNPLAGQLAPGTYTLATYSGVLTGSTANLAVLVPEGTPYTVALGAGALTLTVPVTRAANSATWAGSTSGVWDIATSSNWQVGGSANVFVAGDAVLLNDAGSARPDITLSVAAPVAGLTVSGSASYTVSGGGSIAGSGGLTKSGSGTLTLNTANTFTGPVALNGGVVSITELGEAGAPGALGASSAAASNFVFNGGTLRVTSAQTNTDRAFTLGASGGTFEVTAANGSVQLSGAIGGAGSLTKSGAGTILLASANTYTGGTIINGGKIYLAGSTPNRNGLGSGSVTINNGTLAMADVQANDVAAWNIIVPAGASARLEADGRCGLTGTLTGAGTLTYFSPYVRSDLRGNWSAFTGRINAINGDFRVANTFGYANAILDLGPSAYAYATLSSSTTIALGALSGSGSLSGITSSGRTVTWEVGARGADTTFSGTISNSTGAAALRKVGAGALTLAGACTYTGPTTVSAGKLVLSGGSLTGSAVTVSGGAGFGGKGNVTGNVTFSAGSTLLSAPGAGPLAIVGNVVLGGTVAVSPAPGATLAAGTYPILTYTGTLSASPSLVWSGPGYAATFDTSVAGQIRLTLLNVAEPPTGLVAVAGDGRVELGWSASTYAASYSVFRAAVGGGPYASIATGVTALSYSDAGLINGTTYHYVVRAVNAAGASANSVQASATPVAPLTALQQWRVVHFGAPDATGEAADDADPDLDGLSNLLEYALGSVPLSSASFAPPVVALGAGHLRLTFSRVADPALSYTVQGSGDLVTWADIWSSTGAGNTAGPVGVTDSEALDTARRRFLRLKVSR